MWNQLSVWAAVSGITKALAQKLAPAPAAHSSSLILAQISGPVEQAVSAYTKALTPALLGKQDVVGLAFAVNGVLKSADIYVSAALFVSMRDKLLKAGAVEAIRLPFLQSLGQSPETVATVGGNFNVARRQSATTSWLESRDGTNFLHRSLLKR